MDHGYIQEHQIISLYAMGRLAPADHAGFEEHLLDCRKCQDELELTDDFRRALRHVSEEGGVRSIDRRAGLLHKLGTRPVAIAFAGAALAAILTGFAFLGHIRRLERELERARVTSIHEQQTRQALEAQLQAQAQGAAPLFTLNVTRGAELALAEPPNRVPISSSAKSAVLSLEWENDSDFQSYRATLTDAAGLTLWSADHIPPPTSGALAITLSGGLLQPGRYLITVDGARDGRYSVASRYAFRVTRAR